MDTQWTVDDRKCVAITMVTLPGPGTYLNEYGPPLKDGYADRGMIL